jgi:flagellar biosynthesis protein FliQ
MLNQLLLQLALVFSLEAAIFLSIPAISNTPHIIAGLAKTKYHHNPKQIKALSEQRSYTIVGITLLLISFILQIINLSRINNTELMFKPEILTSIIGVLVLLGSLVISKKISSHFEHLTQNILKLDAEETSQRRNQKK